jgi:hypothetical protein
MEAERKIWLEILLNPYKTSIIIRISWRWYENENITKYWRECPSLFKKIDLSVSENFKQERKKQHVEKAEKMKKAERTGKN